MTTPDSPASVAATPSNLPRKDTSWSNCKSKVRNRSTADPSWSSRCETLVSVSKTTSELPCLPHSDKPTRHIHGVTPGPGWGWPSATSLPSE